MDKLENIFELQDVLNRRIGVKMDEMNDEDRAKWILNYVCLLYTSDAADE